MGAYAGLSHDVAARTAAQRPLWMRPEPCLSWALAAMSAVLLLSLGSLLCLPGLGEHLPKVVELVALFAVGYEVARGRIPLAWPLAMTLGLCFVLHACASGLWAPFQASFAVLIVKLMHAVLLAPILCLACRRIADVTLAVVVFKACSCVCSLAAIAQATLPFLQVDALAEGSTLGESMGMGLLYAEELSSGAIVRASGTLGHANTLSLFLAGSMFLQPWLWLRFPGRRARGVLLAVTLCEAMAMLLTYGRLGIIAMCAAAVWMLMRGGIKRPIFALALAFAAFAVALPWLPATWVERVLDPSHFSKSDSIAGRWELQVYGLQLVQKYGLFGGGYGQFGQMFYLEAQGYLKETAEYFLGHTSKAIDIDDIGAHNVYLEVLVEQGLVGIVLFCGTSGTVVWQLVRLSRRTRPGTQERLLCITFECMTIAFAVAALFVHSQEMKVIWIGLGLACAWLRVGAAASKQQTALASPRS